MDTSLSALRKSLASNFSPKTCSPRSRKNNFQAISRRIVDSCTVPMKGLGVYHASSENPTPQNESRADGIVEVVVQEAPLDMMLSNGQLNSPVCGTIADEAHDMLLTAGLRKQKMDSSCINNAVQKPQESPLDVQPLQVKKFSAKHKGGEKGGETHPIQALEGNSDTFDYIQLKGNSNSSCKEIICALTASTCNAPSPLDKQMRARDAVSRGADSSSNTKVFASKKSAEKKGFKGLSNPDSSGHGTRTVQKRSAKKVAGRQKECFVERQVDSRGPHTQQQQQLNREEKVNVNDGTNQELFPLIPPGFKSICNGQGLLDGEKVDERPIQLHIQDAGGSQCTMENTALRSCSAVGTSLHPPFLSCQISGERFPFIKTSSIWHQIEPMEVFRKSDEIA
ncbi:unnamed protein product [Triticum turgidum subsp. durum]|uniref:Uncharacterized protein n=1 Tax=Triticum turgidum subsp. durum TaxID=4567 RepID=A0A9R0WAW3_TRITD|nr:unnamed protein product [Triticum turgidum subsp. durum]